MKRRLLTVAIFLLLGAVVNVAVAWGLCAVWGGQPLEDDRPIAAQRIWDRYAPEGWPPFDDYGSGSSWGRSGERVWSTTYVDAGDGAKMASPRGEFTVGQVRVGLPFRTFQYGWYSHGIGPNGFRELGAFNAWMDEPRCLVIPYEPLCPAFIANTLFYAAILWLLIPGPFALRRFLRLRRGLCPKCAYPIGESTVCTECGHRLSSHSVTS